MLRMSQSNHGSAAKRYFTEGLAREDYYTGEPKDSAKDERGTWGGKGAERLGLRGLVERDDFARLCENRLPGSGKPLTPRTKANRRVGYDFNFHCPKSVSLLHALTGDTAILTSFRKAVHETMELIEADSRTRVRIKGGKGDRISGNLIWAEFIHTTARPIGGVPDPHLHAHCFTFNATFDPVESRWKAGEFGDLKRNGSFYEAMFHSRLAELLVAHGYAVERQGRFWEVAGVPKTTIDKFSNRAAEIERAAARRGITDPKEKAALGARTRRGKSETKPWAEVRNEWRRRLTPEESKALREVRAANPSPVKNIRETKEAVDYALTACLERKSIIPERKVTEEALRYGVGAVNAEGVKKSLSGAELIRREINGEIFVTTTAVLREEQAMLSFARDGRGTCRPLGRGPKDSPRLSALTREQRDAVGRILDSPDRVILLRGGAGTGKTAVTAAAVQVIKDEGHQISVLAPSASAARGTLREHGLKSADTVAKFLANDELRASAKGGVIWVDEAGMLGARPMARLFDAARDLDARIVLSGDSRQHKSVDRGDTLRILESHAGLRSAEIQEIRRQRGEYKAAIEALGRGETDKGFDRLTRMGAVHEIKNDDERYAAIADAYMAARRAGRSALIVSPTHAEAEQATHAVRERLKDAGELSDSRKFEQLQSLKLSETERSNAQHFSPGLVAQFHQHAPGFRAGERVEVVAADHAKREVLVKKGDATAPLPLDKADRFDVFRHETIELAAGDIVRVTKNGRTIDGRSAIDNGARQTIQRFDEAGNVVLADGRILSKDFAHIDHAYCLTSYGAQGASAQRVIVAQSSESGRAASKAQFYVSASRGVESITIFTDDKAKLKDAVRRDNSEQSATEFVKPQLAWMWLTRANEKERSREQSRDERARD